MSCAKGMTGCRPTCLHRRSVQEYHAARQADLEAAEQATALYPAEWAEYVRRHPLIDFQTWLRGRGRGRSEQRAA